MYLHISSAPHFLIFSTRLSGFFWENLPSFVFVAAILGTQIIALIISVFGGITPKIPFSMAVTILCVCIAHIFLIFIKPIFNFCKFF